MLKLKDQKVVLHLLLVKSVQDVGIQDYKDHLKIKKKDYKKKNCGLDLSDVIN